MHFRFCGFPSLRLFLIFCLGATVYLLAGTKKTEEEVHLSGYVAARTVDCLNPEVHHHDPEYYLVDDKTGQRVRIKGYEKVLKGLHPRQKVAIKGKPLGQVANDPLDSGKSGPLGGGQSGFEVLELEVLPLEENKVAQEEVAADGANETTMLSTLLVFISTDTHGCMTSETNARNLLFDNTNNANLGMQAITKGRYGLQLGNGTELPEDSIIDLVLNVDSANHDTDSVEGLALDKLFDSIATGGMGLNRLAWNRILLFAPAGITDSGFTAYAYYPWGSYTTSGLVSMYGSSYGNTRMNGYLHELGHNFGFEHSSRGGSEYGDRTCVMGLSRDSTKTETYNVAKLLETDWLEAFPNATREITSDTTLDLYPLSSDPNVVDETIALSFPGTNYYAAYHRDQRPYGFLSQSGDRDKVSSDNYK